MGMNVPMNRLFLISGRVAGDDDDTVHIVEADTLDMAHRAFEAALRAESDVHEQTTVFIIYSEALAQAILSRTVAPRSRSIEEDNSRDGP